MEEVDYGNDEVEHLNESREVYDEVNQLGFGDNVFSSPGAESKGNLNVKTYLDQQKGGKRVRPQSSRPMFRQTFMTLDPSNRGFMQKQEGIQRRLEGVASQDIMDEDNNVQVSSAQKSGKTLDIGKFVSESRGRLHGDRIPIPKPSLMKGKSEFAYHLNQT